MAETTFSGMAELQTPNDLLRKMKFDLGRLKKVKNDQYAAFDFFTTAEHMLDWLHPGYSGKAKRQDLRQSDVLLRITSHIANGAKHFEAKAKHHKSVSGIEKQRYVEEGYVEDGFFETPIVVTLSADEVAELGCSVINVVELAERVLEWWIQFLHDSKI